MKTRQSAVSWFQRASRTSASASASSDGVSDVLVARTRSESAIARIVMCVLAEARQSARDPVRGPIDELDQRHAGITEQTRRLGGVDEPAFARLDAAEDWRLAQPLAEALRQPANAHGLRPADVERARRHRAMAERAQHHAVGVALPDHVHMPGREVD